jgi:hypothetical protein
MRSQYFTNKHYLTKDNRRIAHVHIVGDAYTVCGHYKRFTEFKRRTFDKAALLSHTIQAKSFTMWLKLERMKCLHWLMQRVRTRKNTYIELFN